MYTNNAVVDDCSQSSLFPSEAVQVQSQTLKQTLSAQQQQTGAKRLICMKKKPEAIISGQMCEVCRVFLSSIAAVLQLLHRLSK